MIVVPDSSALTKLAAHDRTAMARIQRLQERRMWPPFVPTAVLVESLKRRGPRDANANRLLRTCVVIGLDEPLARRAATLRTRGRKGSAVDAIVVATAEHAACERVLTSDDRDLSALAHHARGIEVAPI